MKMTDKGLALIKRWEGFRGRAYRDPVGIWTVGYGHTSMAGPPEVDSTTVVTRAEADEILARDVGTFADGVQRLLKREVSDDQFSALVSFAFNVGLGNFRRSSVLRAVNAGDLEAVPRRLALWVKAGGRTLPGLIRRRAEEAALFTGGRQSASRSAARSDAKVAGGVVQSPVGKTILRSTTNQAAILSAGAGVFTAVAAGFRDISDATGGPAGLAVACAVMAAATWWIIRERRRKSLDDGV